MLLKHNKQQSKLTLQSNTHTYTYIRVRVMGVYNKIQVLSVCSAARVEWPAAEKLQYSVMTFQTMLLLRCNIC